MRKGNLVMKVAVVIGISFMTASCNKADSDGNMAVDPLVRTGTDSGPVPDTEAPAPPAGWTRISTKVFSIDAPNSWKMTELPAIDTYNGLVGDGKDSMHFDYGIRHAPFQIDPERYSFHYEIIDGRRARIIEGAGYGIAIDTVNKDQAMPRGFILMQSSGTPMDRETAMRVIRSVRFK